ncbi:MAG: hypothetical protein C4308_09590, partial [Chitinophagaceae bacterium]
MSQLIVAKIELENGKQITHYTSLNIRQDLFQHHEFELVVPFELLESKDDHFFNQSHKEVCGKSISFSFESEYNSERSFSFSFKGIV